MDGQVNPHNGLGVSVVVLVYVFNEVGIVVCMRHSVVFSMAVGKTHIPIPENKCEIEGHALLVVVYVAEADSGKSAIDN